VKEYIVNGDGSVEWQCNECSEPMLLFPSDAVTVVVGERGVVAGVICERCANKRQVAKN
jgi:hypothetical protein